MINPYALPAIAALVIKAAVWQLSRRAADQNFQTRLFRAAVLVSFLLSVTEISILQARIYGVDPGGVLELAGYFYFILAVPIFGLFVHLAASITFDQVQRTPYRITLGFCYLCAAVIDVLIAFTPLVIVGFDRFSTYSYTRIPGPLYWTFEWYVVVAVLVSILLPIYGLRRGRRERSRSQCKLWIVTLLPIAALVVTIIVLLHFGVQLFNSTVTTPLLFALHLVAVGYAIHSKRIIDVDFYRPGSAVRREKAAFYRRLMEFTSEAAGARSQEEIVTQLSEILGCAVVLVHPRGFARSPTADGRRGDARVPKTLTEHDQYPHSRR